MQYFYLVGLMGVILRSYGFIELSRGWLILLLVLIYHPLAAQINLKIGYNPSYGEYSEINDLLSTFNAANESDLQSPYPSLHFMHGIELGLRYKWGSFALDAGWSKMTRNRSALLYYSDSDSFGSEKYNFSMNALSLNIDQYIGAIGFGTGIYMQNLKVYREIGNNDLPLAAEWNLALDFHINLIVQSSELVSFVIKPYYRMSLQDYSLGRFAQDLNGTGSEVDKASMNFFGLRFIFYNGKQ